MREPKECETASFPACAIFWRTLIWHTLHQFRKLIHIPCCKLVCAAVNAEERHVSPLVCQARNASNSRDTGLSEHAIQEANKAAGSVQKEQQASEEKEKEKIYVQPRRQSCNRKVCC